MNGQCPGLQLQKNPCSSSRSNSLHFEQGNFSVKKKGPRQPYNSSPDERLERMDFKVLVERIGDLLVIKIIVDMN